MLENQEKFIGATSSFEEAEFVLIGCPLDITSSFRCGSRFAPGSIRRASWTLETFSPYFRKDLEDLKICDLGDIPFNPCDLLLSLEMIEKRAIDLFRAKKKPLFFGGEHSISYAVAKAMKAEIGDIQIVHFDAHFDMRPSYEGMELCHATVMRRIADLGISRIIHIGVRSGIKEEFENGKVVGSPPEIFDFLDFERPVYITFDMDVLDPSIVPGVSTPEPDGLSFREVMEYLLGLCGTYVVGADIVELTPDYDPSFVSSICAAKIAREVLILMS